jgi:hypothetical protein
MISGCNFTIKKDERAQMQRHMFTYKDQILLCHGEEVILGNPESEAQFHVEGMIYVTNEKTPIVVANDIQWASPELEGQSLLQTNEALLRERIARKTWENHLIGPSLLKAARPKDYRTLKDINDPFEYHGIEGANTSLPLVHISVTYPFGCHSTSKNVDPIIKVFSSGINTYRGPARDFSYKGRAKELTAAK